jgi:predicted nucleic acid binding AN1-type Zn finger protein
MNKDKAIQSPTQKSLQECKKKKKKNLRKRCNHLGCSKKLLISVMKCKCNKKFCNHHRLPHQHDCSFVEQITKDIFCEKNGLGGGGFKQIESI